MTMNDKGLFPERGFDPRPIRVPVGVRSPVEHVGLGPDRGALLQNVVGGLSGHGRQALGDLVGFLKDIILSCM